MKNLHDWQEFYTTAGRNGRANICSGNSDPFHESAVNSLLKTKIKEESDLEFDLVM